jgi:hypothetical protein
LRRGVSPCETALVRLFEALLIAFAGQLTLAVAIMGPRRPRAGTLAPLVPAAFLIAHVLLEGPRWQMAGAYLAALVMLVMGLIRYRRPGPDEVSPRRAIGVRALAVLGFLLVIASAAAAIAL